MTLCSRSMHVRRLTVTAVVTAVLSAVAVPAFADTPPTKSAHSAPFSASSLSKAVAPAVTTATPAAAVAPATAPAKAPQQSEGFFKSRTGMIVLAAMAIGTGYAVYSAKEDRIRGIGR